MIIRQYPRHGANFIHANNIILEDGTKIIEDAARTKSNQKNAHISLQLVILFMRLDKFPRGPFLGGTPQLLLRIILILVHSYPVNFVLDRLGLHHGAKSLGEATRFLKASIAIIFFTGTHGRTLFWKSCNESSNGYKSVSNIALERHDGQTCSTHPTAN